MKTRVTLYAEDGMVLTNGKEYGKIIHLAIDADASAYYEITEEEHQKIIESREVL